IRERAVDDAQRCDVVRGERGKIDGCQAAGNEHVRVVPQLFFFALQPGPHAKQGEAGEIKHAHLAARSQAGNIILIGVSAEEPQRGQHHDNAKAHQPDGAHAQFKRGLFWPGSPSGSRRLKWRRRLGWRRWRPLLFPVLGEQCLECGRRRRRRHRFGSRRFGNRRGLQWRLGRLRLNVSWRNHRPRRTRDNRRGGAWLKGARTRRFRRRRPFAPRPSPPIIPRPARPVVAPTHVQAQPAQPPLQPAPIPEPARTEAVPSTPPAPALETLLAQHREEQWTPPPPTEPPPPLKSAAPAGAPRPKESSLELRVGTVWLVRFGIVMVLTALGLFGAYAYQNYIPRLGPGGKVGMLYFASFALLGVGTWLQRKEEKLRNYAHVLVAGGLAAVYFTTFAAYHVTALRIIHSALTDGTLLLVWAGFIVWLADRKKSEIMALFAVLLAYYSSAITHAELFTLYSNLVLTLAAVFFLVRNRWATLSFASLAGTYAGYAFWRFYRDS